MTASAVAMGARRPVQMAQIDGTITAAIIAGLASIFGAILLFVQVIKVKKVDAQQAEINRLAGQVEKLSEKLDQANARQFKLQQQLLDQERSFNDQLAAVKDEARAHRDELVTVKRERDALLVENAELKAQIAQAATIGVLERRQGEQKSRTGAPDIAEVVPESVEPKGA